MKSFVFSSLLLALSAPAAHAAVYKNLRHDQIRVESQYDSNCVGHAHRAAILVQIGQEALPVLRDCVDVVILNELNNVLNVAQRDPSLKIEVDSVRLYNFIHNFHRDYRDMPETVPGFSIPGNVGAEDQAALQRRIDKLEQRLKAIEARAVRIQ